uniref:Serine carboxypeptidase n=1 Tax=Glaciozyma antarctica TaxID=105987 RepID=M9VY56_9BASI|nr:serine carboxypeptidase [Glaciozyma antarctica]
MLLLSLLLSLLAGALATAKPALTSFQLQRSVPSLPLGLFRHLRSLETSSLQDVSSHADQLTFSVPSPSSLYTAHTFDQLVSHDPNVPAPSEHATFKQRYWFDATYYRPGGPVLLLDGGETDGEGRLPFLKEGILQILSQATGGIGVLFEHRYYGKSFPVDNLTTDSFRYLTTMQSLQDSAHFAKNVVFPGLEDKELTSPHAAWLYYGGSYAGAKAAFARKLFPEVWWGVIASSAVTAAIIDFWEYYEPIRISAPPACSSLLINHTSVIDELLAFSNPLVTSSLKSFFGLPNITLDTDFVNALHIPLGSWQGRNWDDSVGSNEFFNFCDAITEGLEEEHTSEASILVRAIRNIFPSFPSDPRKAFASFSAYAGYVKENIASMCPKGVAQDDCFGTDVYEGDDLSEAPWKSWSYQFCTGESFLASFAPEGHPSLVSSLITPGYTGQICRKAFPDGELNRVPAQPNVTEINQWGSLELSYPRLAFIDGSEDPWLYATPHSPNAKNPKRKDTLKRPFKLIPGGVHHWDENGRLDGDVPTAILAVHEDEIHFVQAWMKEWREKGQWKAE